MRTPKDKGELDEIRWVGNVVFPGSMSPRVEAIIASASPYWEVMEVKTRREHYAKTTAEWLRRLRSHQGLIRQRWGDERFEEYDRYLRDCVWAFNKGYKSLVQMSLRRVD